MVYVVGNEQNYHFQITFYFIRQVGICVGKNLSTFFKWNGPLELPEGKMKSREGTVVDADDLMAEMIATARETSQIGELDNCNEQEIDQIAGMVGLGALKYFIFES